MSLDQLRYFVAVAEEGNMGKAARRLHICQPPLSRQIHNLEAELGVQLFRRTPRGVRLSPAGDRVLSHAREILQAVAHLRGSVTEMSQAGEGSRRPDGPSTLAQRVPPRYS